MGVYAGGHNNRDGGLGQCDCPVAKLVTNCLRSALKLSKAVRQWPFVSSGDQTCDRGFGGVYSTATLCCGPGQTRKNFSRRAITCYLQASEAPVSLPLGSQGISCHKAAIINMHREYSQEQRWRISLCEGLLQHDCGENGTNRGESFTLGSDVEE